MHVSRSNTCFLMLENLASDGRAQGLTVANKNVQFKCDLTRYHHSVVVEKLFQTTCSFIRLMIATYFVYGAPCSTRSGTESSDFDTGLGWAFGYVVEYLRMLLFKPSYVRYHEA